VHEVTLPDCRTWIEDGAVAIDLSEVGELRFERHDPAAGHGPLVSVFMPDGETATIDQLMSALSRPLTLPAAEDLRSGQVEPAMADPSVTADLDPAPQPHDPPPSPRHRVALGLRCPMGSALRRARSRSSSSVACPRGRSCRPASRATMAAGWCRPAT
jgi:hypothetical protein